MVGQKNILSSLYINPFGTICSWDVLSMMNQFVREITFVLIKISLLSLKGLRKVINIPADTRNQQMVLDYRDEHMLHRIIFKLFFRQKDNKKQIYYNIL